MVSQTKASLFVIAIALLILTCYIIWVENPKIKNEEENKYKISFKSVVAGKTSWRGYTLILDTGYSKSFDLCLSVPESLYTSIKINDSLEKISNSNIWKLNSKDEFILNSFYDYKNLPRATEIITK